MADVERAQNSLSEPPLSERFGFLVEAAVTYWTSKVPRGSRTIFADSLTETVNAYLDKPQDPRRGADDKWPLITSFKFGVGVHEAYSDPRLSTALQSSDVSESILPRQAHTEIDIETGNVFLHHFPNGRYIKERIFPVLADKRD